MARIADEPRPGRRIGATLNSEGDTQIDTPLHDALGHSEKVGLAFDASGGYWRDYYGRQPEHAGPVRAERLAVFGEALNAVGARGLWLDAGCGAGQMARHFRESGLRVCGIDASAALLEQAQHVTGLPLVPPGHAPSRAEHLYRASVERTPYEDEQFDGAYSSSVLEYAASLELALAELHRVVRREGHLVFNLPNAFCVFRVLHALRHRRNEYYRLVPRWAYWKWQLVRALKRSGWEPRWLQYYGAERNAPSLPGVVGPRLRRRMAAQAWAASFILVVARRH